MSLNSRIYPDLGETDTTSAAFEDKSKLTLVNKQNFSHYNKSRNDSLKNPLLIKPAGNMTAKRIFDLVFSLLGLIFLAPLFLLFALWILIDSPGPIFFRQIRIGLYGKPFRIFKFRTMINNADFMGSYYTINDDPRITSSGRFMRKYKLDELPQLINVLLGEMSLVGPRPQVQQHVDEYPLHIKNVVLSVPPGMTGFASLKYIKECEILESVDDAEQIIKETIIPTKLNYYVDYVFKRNLWIDFKLIITTILVVANIRSESESVPQAPNYFHAKGKNIIADESEING